MQPRKASPLCLRTLVGFEGMVLHLYYDAAGIQTVCEGHVTLPGEDWSTVTPEKCNAALSRDLSRFERAICDSVEPEIPQECFDGCACLAFNIGTEAFRGSTVCAKLNEGDWQAAADAFLLWCNVKVKQKDGTFQKRPILLGRRQAERSLFLSGVLSAGRSIISVDQLLQQAQAQLFDVSRLVDPRTGLEIVDTDDYTPDGRLIVMPPEVEEAA